MQGNAASVKHRQAPKFFMLSPDGIKEKPSFSLHELQPEAPKLKDYVRFVCISDTHFANNIPLPEGDVLIHAGDFSDWGRRQEIEKFCAWLDVCNFEKKIVIAGNHDLSLDKYFMEEFLKIDPGFNAMSLLSNYCTYLQDSFTTVKGLKIYGSPWIPEYGACGFSTLRKNLKEIWQKIPIDTDILITHFPPFGICDKVPAVGHVGCEALTTAVKEIKPMLHVFGHIHEGYGYSFNGNTLFVNASILTKSRLPVNPPFVIDLPIPSHNVDVSLEPQVSKVLNQAKQMVLCEGCNGCFHQ
ncbi:metallophosphoesterase domain-containing protein 1-like isoform X2 [Protopterus annectens]|uniref:metallophosphoesterase domain-containing protein 1-like isoform X2 n=1 Tax=Protopterus annectens TaxID=7888 RepID=UPI001CFA2AEB|nr:metallophosphoesterase domain-containing protein 1-like isoform X2 [Protopterus annectens]